VQIRRARAEELTSVGDVTVAAYSPYGTGDGYVEHLRDAASRDREAELWVLVDDDEILGTVTTCPPGSPWREIARDDEGEFRMLAVAPDAQGRGFGEALVAHVVGLSQARGDNAVVMSTMDEMRTAHRVYGRLGFERIPERDWSPQPGVNLIAFRRPLGADRPTEADQ
jgi:ribosomal protein S18 acetylase RimI-like enzyme